MLSGKTQGLFLVLLITAQSLCAVFFLSDAIHDFVDLGPVAWQDVHLLVETLAALVLVAGIAIELRFLMTLARRQARLERGMTIASGALNQVIEGYFEDWQLTNAEQDVALFTLKGLAIAEVAEMRGSAEGTIKAHLNAIYRKAGVSGRGELLSLVIEDLMQQPLIDGGKMPRK